MRREANTETLAWMELMCTFGLGSSKSALNLNMSASWTSLPAGSFFKTFFFAQAKLCNTRLNSSSSSHEMGKWVKQKYNKNKEILPILVCSLISTNGISVASLNSKRTTAWYKLTDNSFVPALNWAFKIAVPSEWIQSRIRPECLNL